MQQRIRAMLTREVPKKKDSCGWCKLLLRARGFKMKRMLMRMQKVRKRTRSRMKTTLPMVLRPVKEKGCERAGRHCAFEPGQGEVPQSLAEADLAVRNEAVGLGAIGVIVVAIRAVALSGWSACGFHSKK